MITVGISLHKHSKTGRTAKDAEFKAAVSRIRQGGKSVSIYSSSNGASNGLNGASGGCCIIAKNMRYVLHINPKLRDHMLLFFVFVLEENKE